MASWFLTFRNIVEVGRTRLRASVREELNWVYQCPVAAVTNCCKLGGLKHQKFILSHPGGQKCEIKVFSGHSPCKGSGEKSILLPAPSATLVLPSLLLSFQHLTSVSILWRYMWLYLQFRISILSMILHCIFCHTKPYPFFSHIR